MFGKVQEDSFFPLDLSLDNVLLNAGKVDNTFDSGISHNDWKSEKGIIGVRGNNHHIIENNSNRDSISPSLVASLLLTTPSSPLHLQQVNKNNDPWSTKSTLTASKVDDSDIEQLQKLRSSAFASNTFTQNQFEQLQKRQQLSFNEKQQLLFSGSNDIPSPTDPVYRQEQQQKLNHHSNSNQNSFLFEHHQDDQCSSSSSSAGSSSDSSSASGANAKVNTSRYKTEMCRPFQENGSCKYGEKCQFAHGLNELRNVTRHPKYKTDLCRTYHSSGFCPYGPRCHFVHSLEEAASQQLPVNVILRPGQSSSPTSSSPNSNSGNNSDADKAEGGVRPLPMFSPKRNVAPPKPFIGENGCNRFNFELKLNTNTHTSPSYMNVSSGGGGSIASLSPATPTSLDDNCSTSYNGDNARSPSRLPVFNTFH